MQVCTKRNVEKVQVCTRSNQSESNQSESNQSESNQSEKNQPNRTSPSIDGAIRSDSCEAAIAWLEDSYNALSRALFGDRYASREDE